MDFRRVGSFRQRARHADRCSRALRDFRQQRVAVRAQEAIQEFEEHLRTVLEPDDLPVSAEAGAMLRHSNILRSQSREKVINSLRDTRDTCSDTSSTGSPAPWTLRSQSAVSLPGRTNELNKSSAGPGAAAAAAPDVDPRACHRPPSPLTMYDYGSISTRPRSMLAQRSKGTGESMRATFRHSSPGFYFPGPDYRQGPYGFSMMEPIHMPPRGWEENREVPPRWPRDPSDLRPATTEGQQHRHRRARTAGPAVSEGVRSTSAHDRRSACSFAAIDKANQEARLEVARFQSGFFDGRFRDPMLDAGGSAAVAFPPPPVHHFLEEEDDEDAPPAQQAASKLCFGIASALTESRGNLKTLFRAVNRGTVGVLEPHEFLAGLERLGVVKRGEFREEDLIGAAALIDPGFDGRINFTALERAVATARSIQRRRHRDQEMLVHKIEQKRVNTYGEKLPIDVVRIERTPKSLFNFERAFDRFRKQQKELLAHHGELTAG